MGRSERRRLERKNRIEERKNKFLMSPTDIIKIKEKTLTEYDDYKIEALLTCFALANNELYGHNQEQTMNTLKYIDELMGKITRDESTIEDMKKQVEDQIGICIKCE